jgi:hypothetical protein
MCCYAWTDSSCWSSPQPQAPQQRRDPGPPCASAGAGAEVVDEAAEAAEARGWRAFIGREPLPVGSYEHTAGAVDGPVLRGCSVCPRRNRLLAVLATIHPRQWIKNSLAVAAASAAGALGYDDVPVRVGIACAAFCLHASGVSPINDVRDAAGDRLHPRKRYRPVAAG